MSLLRARPRVALLCVAVLLTGCSSGPKTVKDILADQKAYEDRQFKVAELPALVVGKIDEADHRPPGFQKLTVVSVMHFINGDGVSQTPRDSRIATTIEARGGPFFSISEEVWEQGALNHISLSLTYRGILNVREQRIDPRHNMPTIIVQAHAFKSFPDLPSALATGTPITFEGEFEYLKGVARAWPEKLACTPGATYPAAQLNSKLEGSAEELECVATDANAAEERRFTTVYLIDYGVAITTRMKTPLFKAEYETKDVRIDKLAAPAS
jgi:hypothetical protein